MSSAVISAAQPEPPLTPSSSVFSCSLSHVGCSKAQLSVSPALEEIIAPAVTPGKTTIMIVQNGELVCDLGSAQSDGRAQRSLLSCALTARADHVLSSCIGNDRNQVSELSLVNLLPLPPHSSPRVRQLILTSVPGLVVSRILPALKAAFPSNHLLTAVTWIGAAQPSAGKVVNNNLPSPCMQFGPFYAEGQTDQGEIESAERLNAIFGSVEGVKGEVVEDIQTERWKKVIW